MAERHYNTRNRNGANCDNRPKSDYQEYIGETEKTNQDFQQKHNIRENPTQLHNMNKDETPECKKFISNGHCNGSVLLHLQNIHKHWTLQERISNWNSLASDEKNKLTEQAKLMNKQFREQNQQVIQTDIESSDKNTQHTRKKVFKKIDTSTVKANIVQIDIVKEKPKGTVGQAKKTAVKSNSAERLPRATSPAKQSQFPNKPNQDTIDTQLTLAESIRDRWPHHLKTTKQRYQSVNPKPTKPETTPQENQTKFNRFLVRLEAFAHNRL